MLQLQFFLYNVKIIYQKLLLLAELGNKGILALMADSTNAERKGFTMSESSVGEVFDKLFLHCTKRIDHININKYVFWTFYIT